MLINDAVLIDHCFSNLLAFYSLNTYINPVTFILLTYYFIFYIVQNKLKRKKMRLHKSYHIITGNIITGKIIDIKVIVVILSVAILSASTIY